MKARQVCALFLIGLAASCSRNGGHKGYVMVQVGVWPSAQLIGYVKADESPVYQIVLAGVIQTSEGMIVKDVLPGQVAKVLPIIPNKDGVISYAQCLTLFEHLKPVEIYSFGYVQYDEEAAKRLQQGESIRVQEFYAMLKEGKVPPLSREMLTKMKQASAAAK